MTFFKLLNIAGFCLLINACNPSSNLTYVDLINNPTLLEKKYSECVYSTSSECEVVRKAAVDFTSLSRERAENQEEFGMKIIKLQSSLAKKTKDQKENQEELLQLQAMYGVIKEGGSPQ